MTNQWKVKVKNVLKKKKELNLKKMKVNILSFYVKEQQITNHKGQSLFRKTSILSELENVVFS